MSPHPRIIIANFLIRLGRFIQSLALMVMSPKDLIRFSKNTYLNSIRVQDWSSDRLVGSGLNPSEADLIQKIPIRNGNLLVLGVGGGREAIPLSKMGFNVTGVDFIPALVQNSIDNAKKQGILLEGLVQDISNLNISSNTYDVIWMSQGMYSSIPTRKRRLQMMKRIHQSLCPNGYFVCQFNYNSKGKEASGLIEFVRRIFAFVTFGYVKYEKGDTLWANIEFSHIFQSKDELINEFEKNKLNLMELILVEGRGGAISQKVSDFNDDPSKRPNS